MERYLLFILLLWCPGCSIEEFPDMEPVCISVTMNQMESISHNSQTRTSMSGSTATFAANDRIGVSEILTNQLNVPYTYNGSLWIPSPTMYWRNGNSTHTFYAHYPYSASSQGTTASLPILNNQTVSTVPDATCDMLVAGPVTKVRSAGTNVPLSFTHAFSLLQFDVQLGSLLNLYVLNNITIQGGNTSGGANRYGIINTVNNINQISYNLATNSITTSENSSNIYTTTLSRNFASFSLLTSTTPFYFIVLPGTYANPVPAVKFTVALLGLISTSSYSNLSQTTFAPNTKYTFNVRIGGLFAPSCAEVEFVSQEPITINDINQISKQ